MGGPVIETIRPGVQFVPEAARAFRRAEAQVRAEFGRDIDVNSTYRDWDTQLRMYNAWQAYISGRGPHPGHSKALHPADPLAFHTKGLALDSDDWRNARIRAILAEHGFIRNRLHVPNEQHHFEYLRDRDRHINDPAPAGKEEEDPFMSAKAEELLLRIADALTYGKEGVKHDGDVIRELKNAAAAAKAGGTPDMTEGNTGVYYETTRDGKKSTIYLIFNTISGWYHEYSNGPGNGPMGRGYNNPLAAALRTGSYAKVTESHARVIKEACDRLADRNVNLEVAEVDDK